jgi:hypothetical protein
MIIGIDSNNCLIVDTEASYPLITFDYVNKVRKLPLEDKIDYQKIMSFLDELLTKEKTKSIPEKYKEKLKSLL